MIYRVVAVPHIVDGDTLWVQRERAVGEVESMELIARDYLGGRKVRLDDGASGLNTPEVNKPATRARGLVARADLEHYIEDWTQGGTLELAAYGIDDFGRLLGDLYPAGYTGQQGFGAVSYMLSKGWESYR